MIFLLEEKTCRAEMFCTEQQHSMAEAGGEKFPLVFAFVGEYTQKLHDSLKEAVMPQNYKYEVSDGARDGSSNE